MFARRSLRAAAVLLVLPSAAFALGLGDIHLNSALNAPLDAQIELTDVAADEVNTVQAQLASPEIFTRYGLERPAWLANVQVKTQRGPQGRLTAHLTSTEPVSEPFLTLLIEVNWARGHLVREYTILLDPPVYTPGPAATGNAEVAAPAAGETAREGAIQRSAAPSPQPSAAPAAQTPAAPVASAAPEAPSAAGLPAAEPSPAPAPAAEAAAQGSSHVVRRGETLSGIATGISGKGASTASSRQWMLAIYQANPRAFDQNMNLLRRGAVLRIPDASSVQDVSASTASAEIRRQYTAWRSARGASASVAQAPGRLKLVTPTQAAAAGSGNAANAGQAAGAAQQPGSEQAESKRLLEMKNAELARMQAQLAAKQGGSAAAAPQAAPAGAPKPATPAAPTAPAPQAAAAPAPAAASPAPTTAPAPTPAPAAQAPTPAAPAPAATPAPSVVAAAAAAKSPAQRPQRRSAPPAAARESILDAVKSMWWLLALALAGVAGLGAVRYLRARRESEFDDSLGRLAVAGAGAGAGSGAASPGARFGSEPAARAAADGGFLVEESGTHERLRPTSSAAVAAASTPAPRHVASEDTISSDTAINLDQGDPLAEADFHMAYGLYDQAADLVRIAINREPARRDLRLKLLEVFFVWGNKEQFLQTARELAGSRESAAPGEWEKILIMGKQLAPEDPLFSGGGAVSGATAGGVDLDLEGGQSRVDFDLHEPLTQTATSPGVDLDIGAAVGDPAAASESPTNVTDRNVALLESSFLDSTGTMRQMTSRSADESPTVEQPGMGRGDPTIREKLETALRHTPGTDQTAELNVDDLGLDVGALDTADQPGPASAAASSPDAATLVAGMDEHSRRVMQDAQHPTAHDTSSTAVTGGWQFDPTELEAALTQTRTKLPDPSATSRLSALGEHPHDLDVNLGDATGVHRAGELDLDVGAATGTHAGNGHDGLDLDVGSAHVAGDAVFASTQKIPSEDLALPDLEPVTMSEVGTKLDLARAYMDMGDPDGARNILEEVMSEGSAAQKQEAQRLMESLPG